MLMLAVTDIVNVTFLIDMLLDSYVFCIDFIVIECRPCFLYSMIFFINYSSDSGKNWNFQARKENLSP